MASEVERLAVLIEANTKSYESAMMKLEARTDKAIRASTRSVGSLDKQLKGMMGTAARFAGTFGVALGGTALVNFARDAISSLGQIADEADRVGTSTDALQSLQYELRLAGGDGEIAVRALTKVADLSVEAAKGSSTLGKVLAENNVHVRDQNGNMRQSDALLEDYARLVALAGSQQEKLSLASELFGQKAGPKMIAVLERIASVGLSGVVKNAKEAGQVVDEQLVRRADEIGDRWDAAINKVVLKLKTLVVVAIEAGEEVAKVADKARKPAPMAGLMEVEGFLDPHLVDPGGRGAILSAEEQATRDAAESEMGFEGRRAKALTSLRPKVQGPQTKTGALGGQSDAEREADRRRKSIEKVTEALNLEFENLGRTNVEQRVYNELARAGAEADSAAGIQIATLVRQIEDKALAMDQAREAAQLFGDMAYDALDALIFRGEELEDVLKKLVVQLAQMALKATLFNAIGSMFGIPMSGSIFGGFRAGGGDVASGRSYVVGEEGPELFVPRGSGTIVPNGGRGGGGGGPTIINHNDFRGVDPSSRAFLMQQLDMRDRNILAQVPGRVGQHRALNPDYLRGGG